MLRCLLIGLVCIAGATSFCCQNVDNSKKPTAVKPHFTYQVELAGYDFGQADKKGETNYVLFVKDFEEFPWIEQIEKANKTQKVSPTLTVNDNENDLALWVSAMGDSSKQTFLVGYIYPKETKSFLGLGTAKTKKWIEIYLTNDKGVVKDCFKSFFDDDIEGLRHELSKLEKYDEMESQIQD